MAAKAAEEIREKFLRPLMTPDGVPLNLELASYGERASALLIDLIIMGLTFGGVLLFGGLTLSGVAKELFLILVLLSFFALRSFYFIFFEIRWHGRTPGKKIIGLRVIDRKGDVLTPEAVFARNLMREVELWLPMMLFFVQGQLGLERAFLIFNSIWLGIFVLMPFFNKDRLRAGDIIGGTLVIRAPTIQLLKDPVKTEKNRGKIEETDPSQVFTFSENHLKVYGIYELQTLEKVLRTKGEHKYEIFENVAGQIVKKIGWPEKVSGSMSEKFLREFYAALRKYQEGRLLFGQKKRDKFDTGEARKNDLPKRD